MDVYIHCVSQRSNYQRGNAGRLPAPICEAHQPECMFEPGVDCRPWGVLQY